MDSVALPVSASLIHNNLVCSDTMIAFANNIKPNPQIHILMIDSLKSSNPTSQLVKYKNEEEVLHINYVQLSSKWHLILGFYHNLQI